MSAAAAIAACVATFAVHSTVLVALVWLCARKLRSPASQEALWKLALLGAFASSGVQVFAIGAPMLDLPRAVQAIEFAAAAPVTPPGPLAAAALEPVASPSTAAPLPAVDPDLLLAATALLLGLAGLFALGRARWRLCRCLADRQPLGDARALAAAAQVARQLLLRQTPRLSCSRQLASPIAFGWLQPEVCLPERAVQLGDAELRAMLTHELQHLRRRDPYWLWLSAVATALVPWQPLLRLARRRLLHAAELQCDAAAAAHAGGPAVARCLLEVASWHCAGPATPAALAMAARGRALRERIEHVLEPRPARAPRWLLRGGGLATVALLAAAGPGVPLPPAADAEPAAAGPSAPAHAAPALPPAEELAAIAAEAAGLRQQAAALQARIGPLRFDPEFTPLLQQLQQRLQDLDRLRARLQARLGVGPAPIPQTR